MEHKVRTKALSWLLTLAMVVGLLPGFTLPAKATVYRTTTSSYTPSEWGDSNDYFVCNGSTYTIQKNSLVVYYPNPNNPSSSTSTNEWSAVISANGELAITGYVGGTKTTKLTLDTSKYNAWHLYWDSSIYTGAIIPGAYRWEQVQLHDHSWTYSENGATITATCNGEGTCPVGTKTLTLNAPDAAYTGSAYNGASLSNAWTAANDMTAPGSIQYEGVSPTSYAKSATAPTDVGTYQASVTVGSATAKKQFTISKANISPTVSMNGWTYGGTANDPTVSGNSGSGTVTYEYKASTADDGTYTSTKPTDAGTYTVRATIPETANYNGGTATADFTIAKKSLTPTLTGSVSKVYDGTAEADKTSLGITLDGLVNSGDVSATISSAAFDNANVGENKTVTASVTLSGEKAGNYTLSATTASASVGKITAKVLTQSDVTITIDPASYVWTGSPITPTSVTVKLGDTELPDTEYDVAYTDNTNIGTAVATFTFKHNCSGTATANYSITKAAPTYTAPTANSGLVYNKTAQELITAGTATGGELYYRVGDSGTWSKELPKATNAGSYAIYYYVKGDSDHSDVGSEASPISLGVVTIAQKEVTLSWENTAFSYDGSAHIPTATATGVIDGDTCTVTVQTKTAEVGSHTATATALSNANYKLPANAKQNFTISGAKIVYGDDSAVTAPKRGETLKAVLVPTDTGLTYQWYCGDTQIDSATGETYTLTNDDVGKNIKAVIKKEGTDYPSAPVGPVAQVYAVEGIVVKSDGTMPVSGITVKLMQGNTSFGQNTTDTNGKFTINNVPKGSYNLVANGTVDGANLTKTQILELAADAADVKVIMPAGKTASILDNGKAGSFAAVVDGLDDRAAEETPNGGETITVQMTITSEGNVNGEARLTDGDKTAFATGKTAIEALPAASGKTMEYMNIKLDETSSTNASVHTDIGDTNTKVMKIIMQYDFSGRYSVTVFRYHGTTAVALTKGSGADGTFETNEAAGTITIYASKFSTYAIGYSTTPPASSTTASSGGGSGWTALPTRYPLETERTEHGTTEVSHKEASTGTKVIITPKPDKGYEAASAAVRDKDGKLIPVTKEQDGTWSFTMPTSKVTVSVSYLRAVVTPADTGVADWLITDDHIAYLNGYDEDGVLTIHPGGSITRAEVAMIFYRLLKNKDVTITKSFFDVPDNEWYAQAVGMLSSLGILNGYEEGDFRPQNPITRAEFAAIATRFAKATGGTSDFFDVPGDHWAYGNIATAADYGWVTGDNGLFRPEDKITRAEVAAIVNRMLGRKADQEWALANPDKIKYFLDLQDTKQWYYFDMVEASNAHDFTKDDGVEKWK